MDTELTADDLKELAEQFKAEYKEKIGSDFPSDPKEQLMGAVKAVFRSWDNPRANVYRMMNEIPYSWGTAVNVQMMAFGNMGDDCGTGVAFTRNPCHRREEAVWRVPEPTPRARTWWPVSGLPCPSPRWPRSSPEAFEQFQKSATCWRAITMTMQDMEFTVENGKLYMLQTRNGKRTPQAAIKDRLRPDRRGHEDRAGGPADAGSQAAGRSAPSPVSTPRP